MPSRTFLSAKHKHKKHASPSKNYSSRLRFYQQCLVLEQACLSCHSRMSQLSSTKKQLLQLREETESECEEAKRERDKLLSELASLQSTNELLEIETSDQAPQMLTTLHSQIGQLEGKVKEAKRCEKAQKSTIKSLLQQVRQTEDRLQQRSAYVDQLSKSISQVRISTNNSPPAVTSEKQLHSYSSDDVTRLVQHREPSLWRVTDESVSDEKYKRWHSLDQKLEPVPTIKEPPPSIPPADTEHKSIDIQLGIYNTYSDLTSLDKKHKQGQKDEDPISMSDETEDEEVLEEMTEKFSLSPHDKPQDTSQTLSNSPLRIDLDTSLKAGCDTQRRVHFQAEAVFLDAALEGEVDVVRTCLRQGRVDIESKSGRGLTALHKAALRGSAQVVSLLLEKGADINCQDPDGWTPLHCAVSVSNPDMVRHLVLNGSSLFTPNDDADTPLKLAYDECEALHEVGGAFYDKYSSATATECLHFLLKVQNEIGVINGGKVYAVYDYPAEHEDELSFQKADQLRVLKRSSQNDSIWWHAMNSKGRKGLIPGNYFTCYKHTPNVKSHTT
ncbi:SH3 domain protein [Oopsacas minuta]|uniref:SH3 domain protein n=1 Tax=Oopsacas minuta TaxID=111878 RepID=A0AAV7JCJ5_9METZ|nr:SH3 domain protein [Oopsacas minuta]